jgi:hypothetical protein
VLPCGKQERGDDRVVSPFGFRVIEITARVIPKTSKQSDEGCERSSGRREDADSLTIPGPSGWPREHVRRPMMRLCYIAPMLSALTDYIEELAKLLLA